MTQLWYLVPLAAATLSNNVNLSGKITEGKADGGGTVDGGGAIDFRPFETMFSSWATQFVSGKKTGEYSYFPNHPTSIYGSADFILSFALVGRLDEHAETDADKDAWAAQINAFQDPATGLYLAQSFEPHSGPPGTPGVRADDLR